MKIIVTEHKIKISAWALMVYCPTQDSSVVGKQVGVRLVECTCGEVVKSTDDNTQ